MKIKWLNNSQSDIIVGASYLKGSRIIFSEF